VVFLIITPSTAAANAVVEIALSLCPRVNIMDMLEQLAMKQRHQGLSCHHHEASNRKHWFWPPRKSLTQPIF